MERLQQRIGFQADSVENQLEHLESLLLSHLSLAQGNLAQAVNSLHRSLLQPFQRWREHTNGISGASGNQSDHGLLPFRAANRRKLRHMVDVTAPAWVRQTTSQELEEAHTAASNQEHLVPSSPRGATAPCLHQHDRRPFPPRRRLSQVALYLLVWGEGANLRFMPELLFLLFELARAFVAGGEPAEPAATDAFLREVVKPVYDGVFRETFAGLDEKTFRPRPLPAAKMERCGPLTRTTRVESR